jgi:hypothetical protein
VPSSGEEEEDDDDDGGTAIREDEVCFSPCFLEFKSAWCSSVASTFIDSLDLVS